MRAIDLLKSSVLLIGLTWLHGHGSAWAGNPGGPAETFPTSLPQQHGQDVGGDNIDVHGCGKGASRQQPSGMTTVVVVASPSSLSRPSPAKPTSATSVSDTHPDLRRDLASGDGNLPPRRRQVPAAPPVDSNNSPPAAAAPPVAPPSSPLITPAPVLPKGPEYITDPEEMKDGVGTYNGIDANGNAFRFVQTTYYSCVTRGTSAHCGWHRPIVDVVYGSGGVTTGFGTGMVGRVVGIAFLVGGMLFVW